MEPKFIHLRNKDIFGNITPTGGTTIAYIYDQDYIFFAVAYCNPTDQFKKQLGRAKAMGRLKSPRYLYKINRNETTQTKIPNIIITELNKSNILKEIKECI